MARSRLGQVPVSWWGQSALSGLLGGVAMAVSWGIGSSLAGRGFWTPLNVVGTTQPGATAVPTTFYFPVTLGGAVLHLLTAACWGVLFGACVALLLPGATRSLARMVLAGLAFGVVAFLIMGELIAPLLNPAIMTLHMLNYFIGHLVFCTVTAAVLYAMALRPGAVVTLERGEARRPIGRL